MKYTKPRGRFVTMWYKQNLELSFQDFNKILLICALLIYWLIFRSLIYKGVAWIFSQAGGGRGVTSWLYQPTCSLDLCMACMLHVRLEPSSITIFVQLEKYKLRIKFIFTGNQFSLSVNKQFYRRIRKLLTDSEFYRPSSEINVGCSPPPPHTHMYTHTLRPVVMRTLNFFFIIVHFP